MMATAVEVVEEFFARFNQGNEGMYQAIREYFLPETVWDNVGLATTTGVEEAVGEAHMLDLPAAGGEGHRLGRGRDAGDRRPGQQGIHRAD